MNGFITLHNTGKEIRLAVAHIRAYAPMALGSCVILGDSDALQIFTVETPDEIDALIAESADCHTIAPTGASPERTV